MPVPVIKMLFFFFKQEKRDVMKNMKYVELLIVADNAEVRVLEKKNINHVIISNGFKLDKLS